MRSTLLSLGCLVLLGSCAYFNTFYNAEDYFSRAQKVTRENQTGQVTREETQLYAKAIDKSKQVLQKYPDSKYTDDAQFIIARAYFYREDYGLAQRYFEDLPNLYPASPYVEEIPLWIARCLVKRGDLAMARHEAERLIRTATSRAAEAQGYLLLGEIAIAQDSTELARQHLEHVVEESRDGLVRAEAQYQIGELLKSSGDLEAALQAFQAVSRFKPSESLKVQAIIDQLDMLRLLGRSEEARHMIETMLVDDKFVDIRGQLEVELGKIYIEEKRYSEAESRFSSVLETYAGQDYGAQAAYHLGDYYLFVTHDYEKAAERYGDVGKQYRKSSLKTLADARLKQIAHYKQLQLEYSNLERQLRGLPPKSKSRNNQRNTGRRASTRRRGRDRVTPNVVAGGPQAGPDQAQLKALQKASEPDPVAVSPEDSLRFEKGICENRYSLAEYMLFEFEAIDTTLEVMAQLEETCVDAGIAPQSVYMQYYINDAIRGDRTEASRLLEHLRVVYPEYYAEIEAARSGKVGPDSSQVLLEWAAQAYAGGDVQEALSRYSELAGDTTLSSALRGQAQFRKAWLLEQVLLDREAATTAYQTFVEEFDAPKLIPIARERLELIKTLPEQEAPPPGIESSSTPPAQTPEPPRE